MLPDLKWTAGMFGSAGIPSGGVGAKAGKAGKIGAKTGRVVRMARLIRLVKLYKITSQRKREKKMLEDLKKLVELGHIDQHDIDTYFSVHSRLFISLKLTFLILTKVFHGDAIPFFTF